MGGAAERVTAVVIRAWVESDDHEVLKVRVSREDPASGRLETIGVSSSVDDAVGIIRAWLDDFATPGARHPRIGRG